MGKNFGMVAAVIVVLISLLLILQLWGVIHIGFLTVLKSGVTVFILIGMLLALFVIYGMFFWRSGPDLSMREQRELAEKQKQQQQQQNNNSGRSSDK